MDAAGGFKQAGSIVRLKFINFMQYGDTEFKAGPNLNVIIGPNGSGKSTIVNGICLGLAGKTSVLGRASNLSDFIKIGEQEAMVEVELFVPDEENVVIQRTWRHDNKSTWTIRGRKTTQKEVEKVVAHFRIQVDNLCQFLPQDKVHDFSRQNSKGLLNSTVDAVGDVDLKEKHLELKELQKNLNEGDDLFDRKRQMLKEKSEQCQRKEEEVKAFEEKKAIEKKIKLLEGRLAWSKVKEERRETRGKKEAMEVKEKQLATEEAKMNPLKKALKEVTQKKATLESKMMADNIKLKESRGKAQSHSKNIERLEEQVRGVDDEAEEIDRREEEKKLNIATSRQKIAQLEAESNSMEAEMEAVGPEQMQLAKREVEVANRAVQEKMRDRDGVQYSLRGCTASKEGLQRDIGQLRNVNQQKMQVLKRMNDDAYKATMWLQDHREQFQGEVHEPFIISGNVTDPANAMYVENSIQQRDLTAFFFSDANEMNFFMKTMRQEKGWKKVSAVTLPTRSVDSFQPEVSAASLKQYGLISYLRELVTAPDGVLAFLCGNNNLHRVAVFQPQAEQFNDQFVNQFGLNKFFLGSKMQTVSGSRYSSAKSIMTRAVQPSNILSASLDQERVALVEHQLAAKQAEEGQLLAQFQQVEDELRNLNSRLETARKEVKGLEQKKNFKQKISGRIEVEKRNLRVLLAEADLGNERRALAARIVPSVKNMVKAVRLLQVSIKEVDDRTKTIELVKIANRPMEEMVEQRQAALDAATDGLKVLKEGVKDTLKEYEAAKQVLSAALREAREVTGASGSEPPQELVARWEAEQLPGQKEAIDVKIAELETQAEAMDTVDPRIVREYNELKETIQELEQDIQRREVQKRDAEQQMEQVKEAWLESLNNLVSRINNRFSAHFASMGFAGQVQLHKGEFENDFENYGVDIMVKYRDREPLQKLTAHHQSGGERSVATALYMLALQELTTVPFRCVDEINQGMDATNERRVFQLLVRTSCHETSAQYFLLTPKLLSGLDYSPRMNMLIVNNGPGMCHHSTWKMEEFHKN